MVDWPTRKVCLSFFLQTLEPSTDNRQQARSRDLSSTCFLFSPQVLLELPLLWAWQASPQIGKVWGGGAWGRCRGDADLHDMVMLGWHVCQSPGAPHREEPPCQHQTLVTAGASTRDYWQSRQPHRCTMPHSGKGLSEGAQPDLSVDLKVR